MIYLQSTTTNSGTQYPIPDADAWRLLIVANQLLQVSADSSPAGPETTYLTPAFLSDLDPEQDPGKDDEEAARRAKKRKPKPDWFAIMQSLPNESEQVLFCIRLITRLTTQPYGSKEQPVTLTPWQSLSEEYVARIAERCLPERAAKAGAR